MNHPHKMTDYAASQPAPQGFWNWVRSCYSPFPRTPSVAELVAAELDTARRELLVAQTELDRVTATVAFQQARIARLAKAAK